MSFTWGFCIASWPGWTAGRFVVSIANIQYNMWFCFISQLWLSSLTKCSFKGSEKWKYVAEQQIFRVIFKEIRYHIIIHTVCHNTEGENKFNLKLSINLLHIISYNRYCWEIKDCWTKKSAVKKVQTDQIYQLLTDRKLDPVVVYFSSENHFAISWRFCQILFLYHGSGVQILDNSSVN